jgi:hypothetical protein
MIDNKTIISMKCYTKMYKKMYYLKLNNVVSTLNAFLYDKKKMKNI